MRCGERLLVGVDMDGDALAAGGAGVRGRGVVYETVFVAEEAVGGCVLRGVTVVL